MTAWIDRASYAAASWVTIRTALVARRVVTHRSQREIADAVGRSRETVTRWESGEKVPGALDLALWCAALGYELKAINGDKNAN